MTLRVLDLFAGLGGWSAAARDRGHDVRTLDLDPRFGTTYTLDVRELTPATLDGWRPDVVLASPPCEAFSVLRIGRNWTRAGGPRTDQAATAVELVAATLRLIAELGPSWWVIENPRAKLRVLPIMAGLERRGVTYCQLGAPTQKPTDLWGGFPPGLVLPAMCKPGASCHIAAPNGSRTGIQGSTGDRKVWYQQQREIYGAVPKAELAALRAVVPYRLGELVIVAAELGGEPARLPAPAYTTQAALWPALDARV